MSTLSEALLYCQTERRVIDNTTPLIVTFNEAPNIGRVLERLRWAQTVIVLDSYSTDETESIARSFCNVVFVQRKFDTHTAQWNFGIDLIQSDWVLSLDSDYILTDELLSEVSRLREEPNACAYMARFRYCVMGQPLRGSLYPPRAILFRKSRCRYVQDGHTQQLAVDGARGSLRGYVLHDDRKSLARWLEAQRRYAALEANKLLDSGTARRSLADRIRLWVWPAMPATFFYSLIVKRCLFDGWRGWFYALQRTYAELLLSLELLDRRLSVRNRQCDSAEVPGSTND
jgi:glycosyltransferase involved in cell wall biosynthesis